MKKETIYENQHIRTEALATSRVVVVTRSPTRLESPEELAASYRGSLTAVGEEHRGWGLVLDVREAPGRNEGEFERAIEPVRRLALNHFSSMVLLVRTAAGELQVRRMARNDDRTPLIAHDYDEAIRLATPS